MANRPVGQNFILETDGNPNGVITGALNQLLRDWNTELIYICTSSPSGTAWALHATQTVVSAASVAAGGAQPTLVSGTTIKTINGSSVLGSGDLVVSAGPPADGSITNAKLADMATKTYKGRSIAGTGVPADVPVATLKTDLALVAADVALGNVTNESKATMFSSPTFTGTVTGVTAAHVGLGNCNNTSDANKPVSTAQQTALNGKMDSDLFSRVTGSNATTTGQALANIAGLSLALLANSTYEFEAILSVQSSSTAGNRYGVQFSAAGATVEAHISGTLAAATARADRINALNTAAPALVTSGATGGVRIQGIIVVGANAGNMTIQHLKVTSGTSTVFINSFLKAIKRG